MSKRLLGEKKYNEFMEKINKNLPEDEKVNVVILFQFSRVGKTLI